MGRLRRIIMFSARRLRQTGGTPSVSIVTQPQSQTSDSQSSATFSVSVAVSPSYATAGYQWQQFINSQWSNISGATGGSLSLTGLRWSDFFNGSASSRNYRVIVSSGTQAVTSNSATLTVPKESWQTSETIARGAGENRFGLSVACSHSRDVIAIGIPGTDGVGRARIYHLNNGAWSQRGSDIVGEANDDSRFAWSVSMNADGSVVAIGSPIWLDRDRFSLSNPEDQQGRVLVYQWNGAAWVAKGTPIDLPDVATVGGYEDAWFGYAVSLSDDGSQIAVGAPIAQRTAGKVYSFEWNGSAWVSRGTPLVGSQETPQGGTRTGSYAGWSVSMSGDGQTIAYGEPMSDEIVGTRNGAAKIYKWASGDWSLEYSQSGTVIGATMGASIATNSDGSVFAVGQPSTGLGSISGWEDKAGEIRVYARQANGTWAWRNPSPVGQMYGTTGAQLGGFPIALSDDGRVVVAGRADGVQGWVWVQSETEFVDLPGKAGGNSSLALDSSGRKIVAGQEWSAVSTTSNVKLFDFYGYIPT